jgi:cob(I)alamin adenosyltransferase
MAARCRSRSGAGFVTIRPRTRSLRRVKIYTRTGDGGETSLAGGRRVAKDEARVCAYGDVDEANAAIGLARTTAPADLAAELLAGIQRDLFTIGGALAAPEPGRMNERQRTKLVLPADRIATLERAIDAAQAELEPLKAFVLPGGSPKAAALHLARTVCRRAERTTVHLARQERVPPDVLVYLNRLSDLLFTLARLANAKAGVADITW